MFDVRNARGELWVLDELPLAISLRAGEPAQDQELYLRQPDGNLLPVEARGTPIRDETGRPAGAVVVLRDVTERKEIERLRDEWIAVVAHDLRQPVHTIVFAFDLLWEHASADDRGLLERVRSSAMHLNRMIEDLFDAARVTAGRVDVECTYGDIGRIAADAVDRVKLMHPDVQIELTAPTEQAVWVDPERIQQVFGNLLSNAVKYRTPDTPVRVEIVRTQEGVRVGVTNQGPPIEPDEKALLFHRFARTRTARGKRGVGLGLYITRGLVEAHGGRIWVDSEDGTTTFYFTLKVPELPPRPERPAQA
jgi:signal transduction histidine kinase